MKDFLFNLFGLQKCMICKKKPTKARYYLDDNQNRKPVCEKCVLYAERRAYRKA